jgi:antitoxin (DNA-binding transcriptional repressor) of toxin-antitoxin stability system
MTLTVKIGEAKARLSELIAKVEAGEDVIIARGDQPVLRLAPLDLERRARIKKAIEDIRAVRAKTNFVAGAPSGSTLVGRCARALDAGLLPDHVLELDGRSPFAAALDNVLQPVGDANVAVRVDRRASPVARVQVAAAHSISEASGLFRQPARARRSPPRVAVVRRVGPVLVDDAQVDHGARHCRSSCGSATPTPLRNLFRKASISRCAPVGIGPDSEWP